MFAPIRRQRRRPPGRDLSGRIAEPVSHRREAGAIDLANSGRLDSLLRAGNLYLSMQDAIALALENNLDIAIQRYGPQLADAAVLQAEAGGFARGVSTTVTAGPASASVSAARAPRPVPTQSAGTASPASRPVRRRRQRVSSSGRAFRSSTPRSSAP